MLFDNFYYYIFLIVGQQRLCTLISLKILMKIPSGGMEFVEGEMMVFDDGEISKVVVVVMVFACPEL